MAYMMLWQCRVGLALDRLGPVLGPVRTSTTLALAPFEYLNLTTTNFPMSLYSL